MGLRVTVALPKLAAVRAAGAAVEVILSREAGCTDELEAGCGLLHGRPEGDGHHHLSAASAGPRGRAVVGRCGHRRRRRRRAT